jgi:hypothetical protein
MVNVFVDDTQQDANSGHEYVRFWWFEQSMCYRVKQKADKWEFSTRDRDTIFSIPTPKTPDTNMSSKNIRTQSMFD